VADAREVDDLLSAARALLAAREDHMVTAEEWDSLERAVRAIDGGQQARQGQDQDA
jgi:hypothetical protein